LDLKYPLKATVFGATGKWGLMKGSEILGSIPLKGIFCSWVLFSPPLLYPPLLPQTRFWYRKV
jgi:hypothetical protein